MVNEHQSVFITDLLLELMPTGDPKSPFTPAIHSGVMRISTPSFRHIVRSILTDDIDLPIGKLSFVDCGWEPGGAWITMRVRTFIQQNVTLRVSIDASPSGNLLVDVLDARAGMLSLNRLLDPLLDQIVKRPGFIRTGQSQFEIHISAILRAQNIPVDLTARVHDVHADAHMLTLKLDQ